MGIIILAILMTMLVVFMLVSIQKEDRVATAELVSAKSWNYLFNRLNLEEKKEKFLREREKYHTCSDKKAEKKVREWDKQIAGYAKKEEEYAMGKVFAIEDCITLFGYQLLVKLKINAEHEMFRKVAQNCEYAGYVKLERGQETGNKKNSFIYASYLIASLFSYVYLGILMGVFLALVMLSMERDVGNVLIFAISGFAIVSLIGYLPYDGLNARAGKRQEIIDRDIPNVISKITLLITAGMNQVNALEETAYSDNSVMYMELQKAVKEIKQAETLESALVRLQCRCKNKYLDKLITILSKSYIAGNFNLADNLRAINDECWLDKKHNSRRMSEAVQGKLAIPTMLMFVGILVVVIAPAMSGFNF